MNYPLHAFYSLVMSGLLLPAVPAIAQTAAAAPPAEKVYTFVEQMPQPPGGGGGAAIIKLIQQRVSYPRHAELARAEGRVFVSFTVAPSGLAEDIAVVKGFRADCDSAVVEAVKQLPRFEPGRQVGRAVPVRFTVPVTFQLHADQPMLTGQEALNDSSRVYTSVQYMPQYKGEEGTKQLTKDFMREFRLASEANGCALPKLTLYVSLIVGPSGTIYNVKGKEHIAASVLGMLNDPNATGNAGSAQQLPVACEAALVAAAHKLPRLKPGSLNGHRVAVAYTLVLKPPFK